MSNNVLGSMRDIATVFFMSNLKNLLITFAEFFFKNDVQLHGLMASYARGCSHVLSCEPWFITDVHIFNRKHDSDKSLSD